MFETQRTEIEWGGRKLTLETGRMARQAGAAVLAQYGETSVLATVVAAKVAAGAAPNAAGAAAFTKVLWMWTCVMLITVVAGAGALQSP